MTAPQLLRDGIARSVTLLRLFLVVSAALLVAGAFVLTERLGAAVHQQAIADQVESVTVFANDALAPEIVHGNRIVVTGAASRRLRAIVRAVPDILSIKVWRPDGTMAFTTLAPERIGRRFPVDEDLSSVVRDGRADAFLEDLRRESSPENRAEARAGIGRTLTVYAPVFGRSGRVIGAYEVYRSPRQLDAMIARNTRMLWTTVAAVFGALLVLLALLVRGASRRLREQTDELRRSYVMLEQSSLEAIETLNATVEARDPYTAGHSQRVRGIALAVGRQLGLPRERLETLGWAALFHDVGKIGVPDAILTKPGRLDPVEFETIRQHAPRGAEIVAKLSRLKDAVPAVRHHHERWDGLGYPDGLAGQDIPVEASIIGLADAWDAMTTVRPYAPALSQQAALDEIRAGRGSQFRPDVVDAFLAVAATLPPGVASPLVPAVRPLAATG